MKFRKKPVVIEAVYIYENSMKFLSFSESPDWIMDAITREEIYPDNINNEEVFIIATLEDGADKRAKHVASCGDYIIKGIQGELYPCKPDIFLATYEEVE